MSILTNKINKTDDGITDNTNLEKSNLDDKQGNISLTKRVNNKTVKDRPLFSKEVFLTFDDGPSVNTLKILKILDENNVKATFFVIGSNVDRYPDLVRAEYKDGMAILNHSYTHEYSMYKSVESTMADFNKCNASIKNTIGLEPLPYLRFPGGSDNTVSKSKIMKNIRNEVVAKGMEYIDWNVDSGDADRIKVAVGAIDNNLIKELYGRNFAVTLMHDAPAKTTTVEALPTIIDYLKRQGYVFRTFEDLTPTEEKEMIREGVIDKGISK
jgi:Predicted xylanase/chitin deacetylase